MRVPWMGFEFSKLNIFLLFGDAFQLTLVQSVKLQKIKQRCCFLKGKKCKDDFPSPDCPWRRIPCSGTVCSHPPPPWMCAWWPRGRLASSPPPCIRERTAGGGPPAAAGSGAGGGGGLSDIRESNVGKLHLKFPPWSSPCLPGPGTQPPSRSNLAAAVVVVVVDAAAAAAAAGTPPPAAPPAPTGTQKPATFLSLCFSCPLSLRFDDAGALLTKFQFIASLLVYPALFAGF